MQAAIDDARVKKTSVGEVLCDEKTSRIKLARGPLPNELGIFNSLFNITSLKLLTVDSITGTIPTEFGLLTKLSTLEMASSRITSTIPKELFAGLQRLSFLRFNASLEGSVPGEIEQMSSLVGIQLANTLMHGRILDLLTRMPSITDIDLTNSSFSGTIPSNLLTGKVTSMNINNNNFSGTIPTQIAKLTGTITFREPFIIATPAECKLRGNRFTGTMPFHSCISDVAERFIFPTVSPTKSPSALPTETPTLSPTGTPTLSPSGSPVIQTTMPTGTDKAVFVLVSEVEILYIMIAIGGILLALVTAYVVINANYKSLMKINVTAATHLAVQPRIPETKLAQELSI